MAAKKPRQATPEELKRALPKRPKCLVSQREDGFCDRDGRSRGLCVNHYNQVCRLVRLGQTTWDEQERLGHVLVPNKGRIPSEGTTLFLATKKRRKAK